jgi:hypothetical protein
MPCTLRPISRLAMAAILMIVAYPAGVTAQTPGTAPSKQPLQAPVGHRQPTSADVPSDVQTAISESDKELLEFDRKLRICTACGLDSEGYRMSQKREIRSRARQ